jgi:hypothetical protein
MNPYTQRSMIKDPQTFFGRERELRDIFAMLETPQSCSIVGARRVGKSSLLYHICNSEVYRQHLTHPERYVFVFLDLQELAELTVEKFFRTLLERIAERSRGQITVDYDADGCYDGFRKFIALQSEAGWKLVLGFDEFERMSNNPHFDDDFFGYLRGLASNYSLAYVTSSRQSLDELCHIGQIQTSQFWNIFTPCNLGLITEGEARELVTVPFTRAGGCINEDEIAFIMETAGPHPLFIQIACHHLFAAKKEKEELDTLDYYLVRDGFYNEAVLHYRYAWERLDEAQRKALKWMAQGDWLQVSKRVLNAFHKQALVIKARDGPRLFSKAFQLFVQEQPFLFRVREEAGWPAVPVPPISPRPELVEERSRLSVSLWNERSLVVELDGPFSFYTQCPSELRLDARNVERYRRRAQKLHRAADWRFEMQEIGSDLFREIVLAHPEVQGGFMAGVGRARRDESLVLTFKCPRELLSLPVEFLYAVDFISDWEDHLALNHPMTKYVTGVYFRHRPLPRDFYLNKDVRLLFLASNTHGCVFMSGKEGYLPKIPGVEEELGELETLLNGLRETGKIHCQFDFMHTADLTYQEAKRLLASNRYDLVHYAGHGAFSSEKVEDSALFFWKDEPGSQVIAMTINELKDLVKDTRLRFFYLSCCKGAEVGDELQLLDNDFLGIMDGLVVAKIPAILGMRWPLSDEGAKVLAHAFYETLFQTGAIDLALFNARRAVACRNKNDETWASPILVLQER